MLQFIPTSIIVWLATAISLAVGTYCKQSNSIHFAHIWIAIIKFIVTVIAIVAVIRFYIKNKAKLHQHNIWLKLFTFKGIIGLNILQSVSEYCGHKTRHERLLLTEGKTVHHFYPRRSGRP